MKVLSKKRPDSKYQRIFFKVIKECDCNYEISNKGHVRSSKTSSKKILKPIKHFNRYRVNLYDNKKKLHSFYIEDLVNKYFPKQ